MLPRLYLMGVLQFTLITGALTLARQHVLQTPERREVLRLGSYLALELTPLLGQPAPLQAALQRAHERLGVRVTVRELRSTLLVGGAGAPHAPLPSEWLSPCAIAGKASSASAARPVRKGLRLIWLLPGCPGVEVLGPRKCGSQGAGPG
ncbi:hypothetical protein [Myxococcus sp. RHSTA-1-4]|uniref:hypothetical protein n=1 Tax=Myxococcus sp. RHSTA-1-4 TaxID=2874601 RepID=UPI001CBFE880|nr:hypothetical protein [Myxococcus sp. RHSTA-1-4]MBZ4422367.1 hypothetical protein [Myxococcus sp. RHSTA-1-4]